MALKNALSTLALGALMLGATTAGAQDAQALHHGNAWRGGWQQDSQAWDNSSGWGQGQAWNNGRTEVHVHSGGCNHAPMPQSPQHQQGRYELQTVRRWVEGHYQQVWVPQRCRHHRHRGVTRCQGGYYQQQWVPGRYQSVEEWVWVPAPRWNRGWNVGWSVNIPVGHW